MIAAALVLLLQAGAPATQLKAAPARNFSGIERQLNVSAPHADVSNVRIDGVLDEAAWSQAAILSNFSQYEPTDGRAAEDSTQVLVWYSSTALYVAVRAYEAHGGVNATLADRDKITSDDYIQLLIDTFNDGRQALVFGVNPRGVQSDGIRSESATEKSNGIQSASARAPSIEDLTPDFVYESKGRLTDYGYEVEIRVPFKSISFQNRKEQTWGFNVLRRVQHSGYLNTWAPVRRNLNSFLGQSGRLVQLADLSRGMVVDINPSVTGKMNGTAATLGWNYEDPKPDFGGNVRAAFSTNMSLAGTVNPDFSQVEADVGQITSNQRFEISVPEKRPFFLDGSERFETPNNLIYTRRILDPIVGARFAGKAAGTNIGFLSAVDGDVASSTNQRSNPVLNMLRMRKDIGKQSTLGIVYTDRLDGSDYNRVAGVDSRLVFAKQYYLQMQVVESFTRIDGKTTQAPLTDFIFNRAGRHLLMNYRVNSVHPNFQTLSGFVNRRNIVLGNFNTRYAIYGAKGKTIENWTVGLLKQAYFAYNNVGGKPVESKVHFSNNATIKGGWAASVNLGWETYAFDPARYTTFWEEQRIGGVLDTVRYVAPERINNVYGIITRLSTPEFERFSASIGVNRWADVGFVEAVPVYLLRMNAEVNWRPTDKLRVQGLYSRLQLDRRRDQSRLSIQEIPRLKVEYQLARPVFIRFVGQYNSNDQRPLIDPRTLQPLLVLGANGKYTPSARITSNVLRTDWLFSFTPNPGTVIYAGYGASMTEADSFRFDQLTRTNDGFFIKLSYLLRR